MPSDPMALVEALEAADLGTFACQGPGDRWTLSPRARALLDLPPGAAPDLAALVARVEPADRAALAAALAPLRGEVPAPATLEGRLRDAAGRVRRLRAHLHGTLAVDAAGAPVFRGAGLLADDTERLALDERRATMLDSVTDGFVAIDADWRIVFLNEGAVRLIGMARRDVEGRVLWDVFPEILRTPLEDAYRAAARGEPCHFDHHFAPWDRWFHNRCHPLPGGGLVIYFQDITAQRAEAARLARIAESFAQMVNGNPFGVYVVDADFRLRLVSRGARKVFEHVHPLLDRDFAEVLRAIWQEPFASEAIARFRHTLETGEPYASPATIERRADVDAVEAYDWRIERLVLPDGRPGVVCWFYDLSDRQAWEGRLRESELRLESALNRVAAAMDVAELGIHQWEVATGAIWWDARVRAWWDVPPGEAVTYDRFVAGIHPDDRAYVQQAVAESLDPAGGGRYEAEYRVAVPGRPLRWVRAIGLVQFEDGVAVRMTGAVLDVSAQKAQEAALREADRRKDRFLATLSHELRNPLAPIRTAAELLGQPAAAKPQLAWAQGVIRRQVAHMARLLDDLLDVARITQGKLALRREHVALAALVDTAVETARPGLDARGHALALRLPPAPVLLHVDPHRMAQVLANLLTNAARYTPAGGHVEVRAAVEGDTLRLAVRDDGIGLAADAIPALFEMFTQVAGGVQGEGGLGIGLALVRGIVRLHGGEVAARSEGPGAGSEFEVVLPGAVVPAHGEGQDAPEAATGGDGVRILVVDDNRDAADTLALLLQAAGHEVRAAYGGDEALEVAEDFHPALVLLDVGMPGRNGYEVAAALRGRPWAAGICLVAVTGWGQQADRRDAAEAGFDEHFTKPADARAVLELAARVAGGACAERRRPTA